MSTSEIERVVICRTCIAECTEYKSLYKPGVILGEVTTLAALLNYCTNLEFCEEESNKLPRYICKQCMHDLARSYVFKKKAIETQHVLQLQLKDGSEYEDIKDDTIKDIHEDNGKITLLTDKDNLIDEKISINENENENENEHENENENHLVYEESDDLQELAEAAQIKRAWEQQECDSNDQYIALTVIPANEQDEDDSIHQTECPDNDEENVEYVVHDGTETAVIYHTNEIEMQEMQEIHEIQPHEITEQTYQLSEAHDDEDTEEYEIHINNINEDEEYMSEIISEEDQKLNSDTTDSSSMQKLHYAESTSEPETGGTKEANKIFKTRIKPSRKHKECNPEFKCKICDKQLSTSSSFKYHMQLHSDLTPFLCSLCGEGFKTRNAYEGHLSMHDPNNPNTCEICGKTYRQPSSLRMHMLSHTGEKPFTCDICGKKLTQKSGYKKHMLTHTGEKPHSCDICGKQFRYSSNMLAHRRCHTGEKPYGCPFCGKCFVTSEQAKRHSLVHSEFKAYCCDICSKRFKRQETLRSHQQSHKKHTEEKDDAYGNSKQRKSNIVEIM